MALGTLYVNGSLRSQGFEMNSAGKLNYWKLDKSKTSDPRVSLKEEPSKQIPIIFFHGIGGIFSYLPFVEGLAKFGCDIVLVEMPYVSFHVAPSVPSVEEHITSVRKIMDDNGFEKAIIVGHSFGSNVMSWLVQAMPERVAGAVFLDPVVFMLHLKDISFNWLYSTVANFANRSGSSFFETSNILGIVKTELFSVHAVQRHLVWSRNVLWAHELQDLGVETLVIVSDKDDVVPSMEVMQHITDHNTALNEKKIQSKVRVESLVDAGHGDLVFDEAYRAAALEKIFDMTLLCNSRQNE